MHISDCDNRIHRVLWTGGFDSTYRMIELALQDVIVEPVYVANPGRRSRDIELAAMEKMLKMLRNEDRALRGEMLRGEYETPNRVERFHAEIRDVMIINKEDILLDGAAQIPIDKDTHFAIGNTSLIPIDNAARLAIHEAYERLHAAYDIGPQYEWLAALSKSMPDLEICIEKAPEGRLHSRDAINAAMNQGTNEYDENVRVAVGNSSLREDVNIIFGDFILPIFDKTEEDMLADIHAWGCEDIIQHVWFCNHPLYGHIPCGICHPCQLKIESGMKQLLPASALERYQTMKTIEEEQNADAAREYRMNIWIESGIK